MSIPAVVLPHCQFARTNIENPRTLPSIWHREIPLVTARPCGKVAKRGEPQIYLLCVMLWAAAGAVVSPRAFAFAVPVPEGISGKQKRATLASTCCEGLLG